MNIRVGAVVVVPLPYRRPGVVLQVRRSRAGDTVRLLVAAASTELLELPHVELAEWSWEAAQLGPAFTTRCYFYRQNVNLWSPDQVEPRPGRCPPGLLFRINGLRAGEP